MSDTPLFESDLKRIREAWIWAVAIIAIGAILATVGGQVLRPSQEVDVTHLVP